MSGSGTVYSVISRAHVHAWRPVDNGYACDGCGTSYFVTCRPPAPRGIPPYTEGEPSPARLTLGEP